MNCEYLTSLLLQSLQVHFLALYHAVMVGAINDDYRVIFPPQDLMQDVQRFNWTSHVYGLMAQLGSRHVALLGKCYRYRIMSRPIHDPGLRFIPDGRNSTAKQCNAIASRVF